MERVLGAKQSYNLVSGCQKPALFWKVIKFKIWYICSLKKMGNRVLICTWGSTFDMEALSDILI